MENKINERPNHEITSEIIEKLKGKSYSTAIAILNGVKDNIEIHMTLH